MNQAYGAAEDAVEVVSNRRFQKTVGSEWNERKIPEEREELIRQHELLEHERQEFMRAKTFEEKRLAREKRLFDMEWQMLEEEWHKLSIERERLGHTKSSDAFEEHILSEVTVSMFFSGVKNMRSLKKRYKDLIKIFHPDNAEGDTETIQKINEEYEHLKRKIEKN
ncbi:MAG: J domain-containing protein [Lachnospiraceae bacterium]|nr:J domain-containing protein [Lachnospiraceae bacterium]